MVFAPSDLPASGSTFTIVEPVVPLLAILLLLMITSFVSVFTTLRVKGPVPELVLLISTFTSPLAPTVSVDFSGRQVSIERFLTKDPEAGRVVILRVVLGSVSEHPWLPI